MSIHKTTNVWEYTTHVNQHNVLYDLSALTDYEEILFTAILNPTKKTTKKFKYVVTKRNWVWEGNNSIDGLYTSVDEAYRNVQVKRITIQAPQSPYMDSNYTDGRKHILKALSSTMGCQVASGEVLAPVLYNQCNPTSVYYDVVNKELEKFCKAAGYTKLIGNTAFSSAKQLCNAKYFVTDSSTTNYIVSQALNVPTAMIWIDIDYSVLGFVNQNNYYIAACKSPLCRRPNKIWIQPCPFAAACNKDYNYNGKLLFQQISKEIV